MTNQSDRRRLTDEYHALLQVAQLITTLDLDRVLTQILQITNDVIGAKKGSILLLDINGAPYRRFILQRDLPPEMSQIAVSRVLERGLAGWVVREKHGAIVSNVNADERWLILPDDDQADVASALCVPFLLENRVQGVMTLVNDVPNSFTDHSLELATAIAGQASMVIHNAYLFDDVQTHQRQLETVLQNVGEPIFMLNHDFRFTLINQEAATLLGKTSRQLIGQPLDTLTDNPMWIDLTKQLLETSFDGRRTSNGGRLHYVFELRDEQAGRDFKVNVSKVRNDTGFPAYVVIFSDITSMKDLSRLKSHMLRMASHDLKNPLHIALGYINLMLSDIEEGLGVDGAWVNEVFKALDRMNDLIDDLLGEDRIERESKFRSSLVNPYQLIEDTVNAVVDQLVWKKHHLVYHVAPNMTDIRGDTSQLRQAMVNFMTNAIKYTTDEGTITIHARIEQGRFHFAVEDTGIGIPEALQADIFQRGYRADRNAIQGIEGTGIGLSLVEEICRRHKGRAWFTSKEGEGSTFGFSIPVEPLT